MEKIKINELNQSLINFSGAALQQFLAAFFWVLK